VLAGAVSLLIGWIGVSDKVYPGEQIPYIASAGLLGVCLVAVGAVLWLSADLRDEWRKLDRIEELMRTGQYRIDVDPGAVSPPGGVAAPEGRDLSVGTRS
jgi:hypothetical protein